MTKIANCIITVLILLLGAIGLCSAEPNSAIRYLMNEPVSVFDLGIYRIDRYLNRNLASFNYDIEIFYSWEDNRIYISNVLGTPGRLKSKQEAKKWCESFIRVTRGYLRPLHLGRHFFSHNSKLSLEDIMKNIAPIIEVSSTVYIGKGNNTLTAKSDLFSNEIFYSEKNRE